ncbi:MAG: hypothetical protein ACK5Q7_14115 [Cyanobacteriota bacterium]|jgi:hypothetical protein
MHIALPAFSLAMAREWAAGEGKNFGFGFGEAVALQPDGLASATCNPEAFNQPFQ